MTKSRLGALFFIGFSLVRTPAEAQGTPPAMNLSRYMPVTASTGSTTARYALDGLACEESRWVSSNTTAAHWLEVTLPGEFQIGSANLVTGAWDTQPIGSFTLQYWNGSSWSNIPDASVTGNSSTQLQIVFSSPVTTTKVRFYSDVDGSVAIKELAIFPPRSNGLPWPIDTEIDIRSAMLPMITASSQNVTGQRPFLAYDGFVDDSSRWISANVTSQHWLEFAFVKEREVAYAHVYNGLGNGSAIANFRLQSWNAATSAWQNIPGGTVTGNTSTQRIVTFTSTVRTTKVRLVSDDDGFIRVKELVLLPPNGGAGYPLGTGVTIAAPPTTRWGNPAAADTDGNPPFADHFYQIQNRAGGLNLRTAPDGSVTLRAPDGSFSQQYNILLNIGTDTYRICNRANEHCLEVENGSLDPGATIREGDYNALPYQQWRLAVNGAYYELVNAYSGLILTANGTGNVSGAGLVQLTRNAANQQHWSFDYVTCFPKKGNSTSEVSGDYLDTYNTSHYYNWGLRPNNKVSPTHHQPMLWNDAASRIEDLVLVRPEWAVVDVPKYLIGYNEPSHTDQANMTVQQGLDEWSRMEQVKLPLVTPQPDWSGSDWNIEFCDQADQIGMRIDEGGCHIYPTSPPPRFDVWPGSVADSYSRQNQRVQWITEFNWVNWSGAAQWTDDEIYTVLAETLWRLESDPLVRRYQFFAFNAWWVNGAPGAFEKNGILPLGRLYSSWDGDQQVRNQTWYQIHNRITHAHLQNSSGTLAPTTIDTMDTSVHWFLTPATSNRLYLVASDGRRLSYNGSTLSMAAPGSIGSAHEWVLTPVATAPAHFGWYYLDHPASGKRLDSDSATSALAMYANTNTWETLRWRFIKPFESESLAAIWTADTSGNWSDLAKWNGIPGSGPGVTADFSTVQTTADRTVTLDSNRSIGSIRFGDTSGLQNWTLSQSSSSVLTLDGGSGKTPIIHVANNTATLTTPLAGDQGFDKTGSGDLVLAGANLSLTGTINLDSGGDSGSEGNVRIAHPDALAAVDAIQIRTTNGGSSTIQLDGAAGNILIPAGISVNCRNNDIPAIRNVAGTNRLTGDINLNIGGNRFNLLSDAGLLVLDGAMEYVGSLTAARTYQFSGNGDYLVRGIIPPSRSNSAVISISKSGGGTLTLGSNNTYTGTTSVQDGMLVVNGSTGTGATTLFSGATIAGSGRVRGSLTAQSGSTVQVGGTTPTVHSETLLDDLTSASASYTSTVIYDANAGPTNSTTWKRGSGGLSILTTSLDGMEQLALTRTDVTLGVGREIQTDYRHNQLGSQDIGLYVGAGTPATGIRRDYLNIYVRDDGGVQTRGFNGTTEFGLVSSNGVVPEYLFIARTSNNTFQLGYYKRGIRTVLATRTMSSGNVGSAIGFFADIRSPGIRGSMTKLRMLDTAASPVGDVLTIQGNLNLQAGATLAMNVFDPTLHGELQANSQVSIAGNLSLLAPSGIPAGTTFTLIEKTSPGAISGTFAGTTQRGLISQNGYSWIIDYTGGDENDLTLTTATPHQAWRWQQFGSNWENPALAADNADPDGDGMCNLIERAFGGNPNLADAHLLPRLDPAAPLLSIRYLRAKSASDLTFTVQQCLSPTLSTWTPAAGVHSLIADDGTMETWRFTTPATPLSRKFLRIGVQP